MQLSRICSEWKKGYYNIHQYGYMDDGTFTQRTDRFDDYFYIDADQLDIIDGQYGIELQDPVLYKSIYGVPVRRVECKSIKTRIALQKKYPQYLYESDVDVTNKFVNTSDVTWSTDRNICFFDIETWVDEDDQNANKPINAQMPITSIVMYSTHEKQYYVCSWHPIHTAEYDEPKQIVKDNVTYIFCRTEEEVILSFLFYISSHNIDIISGWWSSGYDLPYIIKRCQNLNLPYQELSPINEVQMYNHKDNWRIMLKGLDHIDLMEAVKDLGYNYINWKLTTIAKEVLKDPNMDKLMDVTWRDWSTNYEGFIKYAIRDVELLVEIEKSLHIFEVYLGIQQFANLTTLNQVFMKSVIVDSTILKEYQDEFKFPTKIARERGTYAGAIVIDPTNPGVTQDVSILDYTSLYPTTMMAYNISPETYICSECDIEDSNLTIDDVCRHLTEQGIQYIDTGHDDKLLKGRYLYYAHSHKIGIIPRMVKKLFAKRKLINENLSKGVYKDEDKNAMYLHQKLIKIILNSMYGAFGFNRFRLYRPEVADTITFFARQSLKVAMDYYNKCGHDVIYSDSVAADSSILLKSGNCVTIEELFNSSQFQSTSHNKEYRKTCHKLPYLDPKDQVVKYGSVGKIMRHRVDKDMYRLTLSNGKSIDVTEDHSLMVRTKSGSLIEKKPKDLNLTDVGLYLLL
jgi:DNA polymerase elongation subunit (family B)